MKDPEGKIELAKAENKYLLDNFELYKDSFAYPHMIKIGLGKNANVANEEKFKEFLKKNPDAPFMWGDEMQLQITANMHCVRVNVLKVSLNGEGWVRTINPDPRVIKESKNKEKDSDIWLMLKGEHYDTLVKEDSPLFREGNVADFLERIPEGWKQSQKTLNSEREENESDKDKLIKSLRSE